MLLFVILPTLISSLGVGNYAIVLDSGGESYSITSSSICVIANPSDFTIAIDEGLTKVSDNTYETGTKSGTLVFLPKNGKKKLIISIFAKSTFACEEFKYLYDEFAYYTMSSDQMQVGSSKCIFFNLYYDSIYNIEITNIPNDYSLLIKDINGNLISTQLANSAKTQRGYYLIAEFVTGTSDPLGNIVIQSTPNQFDSLFTKTINSRSEIFLPSKSIFVAHNPEKFTFTYAGTNLNQNYIQTDSYSKVTVECTQPHTLIYTIYSIKDLTCSTFDIYAGSYSSLNIQQNTGNITFTPRQKHCYLFTSVDLLNYSIYTYNHTEAQTISIYDDNRQFINEIFVDEGVQIVGNSVFLILNSNTDQTYSKFSGLFSSIYKANQMRQSETFLETKIDTEKSYAIPWTNIDPVNKTVKIEWNSLHFTTGSFVLPLSNEASFNFPDCSVVVFHNPKQFTGKLSYSEVQNFDVLGDTKYVGFNLTSSYSIQIKPSSPSLIAFSVIDYNKNSFTFCNTFDIYIGGETYYTKTASGVKPPQKANMTLARVTNTCIWFISSKKQLMQVEANGLNGDSFVTYNSELKATNNFDGTINEAFASKNFIASFSTANVEHKGYIYAELVSTPETPKLEVQNEINGLIKGDTSYLSDETYLSGSSSSYELFSKYDQTGPKEPEYSIVKLVSLIVFACLAVIFVSILAAVTIYKKKKKEREIMEEGEDREIEGSDDANANASPENTTRTQARRNSAPPIEDPNDTISNTGRRHRGDRHHHSSRRESYHGGRRDSHHSGRRDSHHTGRRETYHGGPRDSHHSGRRESIDYRPQSYDPKNPPQLEIDFRQPGMPDFTKSAVSPPAAMCVIPQNSHSSITPYISMQPSFGTLQKVDSTFNPFEIASDAFEIENPYKTRN